MYVFAKKHDKPRIMGPFMRVFFLVINRPPIVFALLNFISHEGPVIVKKSMKTIRAYKYLLPILIGMLIIFISLDRIYTNLTDGFNIYNINSEFNYRSNTQIQITRKELDEVNKILGQKFTYLSKGAQVYAFQSEDGNYVLKIVKQKHLKIPKWTKILLELPGLNEYRENKNKKYKHRAEFFLNCCHLTFYNLKNESGLVYMHLNRTENLHPKVILSDKLGYTYSLEMDNFEFLVQKKAELLFPLLSKLIKEGKQEEAFKRLQDLVQLLIDRSKKGIIDRDSPRRFGENIGFADSKPVFIDFGEFSRSEIIRYPAFYKAHIRRQTKDLVDWLLITDSILAERFNILIESIQ
jgi:hypothetical protein